MLRCRRVVSEIARSKSASRCADRHSLLSRHARQQEPGGPRLFPPLPGPDLRDQGIWPQQLMISGGRPSTGQASPIHSMRSRRGRLLADARPLVQLERSPVPAIDGRSSQWASSHRRCRVGEFGHKVPHPEVLKILPVLKNRIGQCMYPIEVRGSHHSRNG